MARTWRHPLSGFEYDIEAVADHFEQTPHDGTRAYDWWNLKTDRGDGGMRDGHPIYLLPFEVEIAAWRLLAERRAPR